MKWREEFRVGEAQVDEQHKALFAFTDSYGEALRMGGGEKIYDLFLDYLVEYTRAHFDYEGGCMRACNCPIADRNAAEHAAFLTEVERRVALRKSRPFDRQTALGLLEFVENWLVSHICRIDVQLGQHLAAQDDTKGRAAP